MGREFELKYRANARVLSAIAAEFGGFSSISMETTYYDTPDRRLSAQRITLRRRLENGRSVCTVKTPASGGARGEWEVEMDAIGDAITALCKLSDVSLPSAGELIPVCGAKFTRLAKTENVAGCMVEIALDSGILLGGGKEIPLCEVEVELKDGSEQIARVFAVCLAEKYHLPRETKSKFRRALALAEGE